MRKNKFLGVYKNRNKYVVRICYTNTDGEYIRKYKSFDNEIDAALYYNDCISKRKGLCEKINTVPVPGFECLGDCEWRLGCHYFTKEDLGEDMDL